MVLVAIDSGDCVRSPDICLANLANQAVEWWNLSSGLVRVQAFNNERIQVSWLCINAAASSRVLHFDQARLFHVRCIDGWWNCAISAKFICVRVLNSVKLQLTVLLQQYIMISQSLFHDQWSNNSVTLFCLNNNHCITKLNPKPNRTSPNPVNDWIVHLVFWIIDHGSWNRYPHQSYDAGAGYTHGYTQLAVSLAYWVRLYA